MFMLLLQLYLRMRG